MHRSSGASPVFTQTRLLVGNTHGSDKLAGYTPSCPALAPGASSLYPCPWVAGWCTSSPLSSPLHRSFCCISSTETSHRNHRQRPTVRLKTRRRDKNFSLVTQLKKPKSLFGQLHPFTIWPSEARAYYSKAHRWFESWIMCNMVATGVQVNATEQCNESISSYQGIGHLKYWECLPNILETSLVAGLDLKQERRMSNISFIHGH